MDPITYLSAGVLAPLTFHQAPRTGTIILFGLAAGLLPAIDFFARSGPEGFTTPGSMSHSLLAIVLFAAMLTTVLKFVLSHTHLGEMTVRIENGLAIISRADEWGNGQMFTAALLGLGLHVYLECLGTSGAQLFWPFYNYRVVLSAMFTVDPFLTAPLLLIALYCLAVFKKPLKRAKQLKWARLGIAWGICYPLVCLGLSMGIDYKYNRDYTEMGATVEKISLVPVLGSPFFWKMVGENQHDYRLAWTGLQNAFDEPEFLPQTFPKPDAKKWLQLQNSVSAFRKYARLAGFVTVEKTQVTDNYVEYTYRDLRHLYSVPNFVTALMPGFKEESFQMQTRQDIANGQLYAWRHLEKNSDLDTPWVAVRPPLNIEENE